jgi:hypothetical protein
LHVLYAQVVKEVGEDALAYGLGYRLFHGLHSGS